MRRTLLILGSLVAALVLVAPATAATKTVSIKRASFSPATVNIVAGDSIRWHNDDTQNHQIVSTTGAFASPVLARGRTYTFRFDVAGTYRYRDALNPSVTGTVRVAGAPPAVTLAISQPQIAYGQKVTLTGQVNSKKAGENVQLTYQPYGQASEVVLATVLTGADGTFYVRGRPEDPHHLPGPVEDRREPRDHHGRRAVDLVRTPERVPRPRLRRPQHGPQADPAAAPLRVRAVGHDQAGLARPQLACALPGDAPLRAEPLADRDVGQPVGRRVSRRAQPRDHVAPRLLATVNERRGS